MLVFFLPKSTFEKVLYTIREGNLNPDQVPHSVCPELDPNCLQRTLVDIDTREHWIFTGILTS